VVHVFVGAALAFFAFAATSRGAKRGVGPLDSALIVASLAIPLHDILEAEGIEMRTCMGPNSQDVAAAAIGILLVLEFARRNAGLAMPIIALVFIAYGFVGPWMPGMFCHRGVPFAQAVSELFNNNGLLGTIVQVSSSCIIMFVTFAAFLQASRAGDYFNELVQRTGHGPRRLGARGTGQGCGRLLLPVRDRQRLLGRPCGRLGHFHHPDDEAQRL